MTMLKLDKKEKRIFIIWTVSLIGFFGLFTAFTYDKLHNDRVESHKNHLNRMDPNAKEANLTWVNPKDLKEDKDHPAEKVKVGIYVDHIAELSTKNTDWTVDFYIWFKWKSKNVHPGNDFHVIDGNILSLELVDTSHTEKERYSLYKVQAQITKFFNITRYPRDDHMLTISIENKYHPWSEVQYIVDSKASAISSRGGLPGYTIDNGIVTGIKAHPYKTNRGHPDHDTAEGAVHDRFILGINISRSDWGLYYKMFLFLFASVAVAFLVFLMKPISEERVGLGIGAFFSAVASSYVSTQELPGAGVLTLCDMINMLGMVTIFLTVLCSVLLKRVAVEDNIAFAKLLNRVTFWIFLAGFVVSNIIIAQTASS